MKTSLNISIVLVLISMIHVFQVTANALLCYGRFGLTDRLPFNLCDTQKRKCETDFSTKYVTCPRTCSRFLLVQQSQTEGCQTNCRDNLSTTQCRILAQNNCCNLIHSSCPLTCNRCTLCEAPPPPCSYDCKDMGESCSHWKGEDYCDSDSEYYGFMQNYCKQTCGFCNACPTPAPQNIALPPTYAPPPRCLASGCEDENPSCEYWAVRGFCNSTSAFPYLLEVCPKSCNVCVPCARPQQSAVPIKSNCSEDCIDSNEDCVLWRTRGYCNITSKYYAFVKETCPASCNICDPCNNQTSQITTALPITSNCSEDCIDNNAECGFWRTQGHCNSTSEHYLFVKQLCPATCNFCNPCNNQTSQTTTEVEITSPLNVPLGEEAQ